MSTARVARSVKLDPEIDARLTALAQRTGRTKSFYMNRAIESALGGHRAGLLTAG